MAVAELSTYGVNCAHRFLHFIRQVAHHKTRFPNRNPTDNNASGRAIRQKFFPHNDGWWTSGVGVQVRARREAHALMQLQLKAKRVYPRSKAQHCGKDQLGGTNGIAIVHVKTGTSAKRGKHSVECTYLLVYADGEDPR